MNGYDAWRLFTACAAGDLSKAKDLLARDRKLANAQFWYQFPIHMAVREGHTAIVKLNLDRGADPGESRFTYNSWNKLLAVASVRKLLTHGLDPNRPDWLGQRDGAAGTCGVLRALIP